MSNKFSEMIDTITPEGYENLKQALALGRWASGDLLTGAQKQYCMQAIIAYEAKNIAPQAQVAYMHLKKGCEKITH